MRKKNHFGSDIELNQINSPDIDGNLLGHTRKLDR